jgi:hypothetical protein
VFVERVRVWYYVSAALKYLTFQVDGKKVELGDAAK